MIIFFEKVKKIKIDIKHSDLSSTFIFALSDDVWSVDTD